MENTINSPKLPLTSLEQSEENEILPISSRIRVKRLSSNSKDLLVAKADSTTSNLLFADEASTNPQKSQPNTQNEINDLPSIHNLGGLPTETNYKGSTSSTLPQTQSGNEILIVDTAKPTAGQRFRKAFQTIQTLKHNPNPNSNPNLRLLRFSSKVSLKSPMAQNNSSGLMSPSNETLLNSPMASFGGAFRRRGFIDSDSNGIENSHASRNKWRKIRVLVQAVSKMKKNRRDSNGPELSKKQLELLYDFGIYNNKKPEIPAPRRQLSIVSHHSSRIEEESPKEYKLTQAKTFVLKKMNSCSLLLSNLSRAFKRNDGGKIVPAGTAKERLIQKRNQLWSRLQEPINPSGRFRLCWDVFLLVLVIADMIILPLQISFSVFGENSFYQFFCNIMFIIDIGLNCRTGFYLQGDLITDQKEILRHYLRTWMIPDCISAFPFDLIESSQETASPTTGSNKPRFIRFFRILRLIKIVRALRFLKLSKIFWKFKVYFGYTQARNLFELLKVLIVVLLLSHWLACIWHLVAVCELQYSSYDTWLERRDLLDASPSERYINSLYWAVTTMLTVGYGDITPASVPELWTAVVAMLLACGVFAFSFNTIGTILNDISQQRAKIRYFVKLFFSSKTFF